MTDPSPDTRTRILEAAAAILAEGSVAGPSVRAVAARAGVGVGTLRHHFPTQSLLLESALEVVYAQAYPDGRIADRSLPAVDRLVECLANILTPLGSPERARTVWRHIVRTLVDADPQQAGPGYAAVVQQAQNRVESWLAVLETEGALHPGPRSSQATYLLTVANGLAIARVMPDGGLSQADETLMLRAAARTVLRWDELGVD